MVRVAHKPKKQGALYKEEHEVVKEKEQGEKDAGLRCFTILKSKKGAERKKAQGMKNANNARFYKVKNNYVNAIPLLSHHTIKRYGIAGQHSGYRK